MESSVDQPVTKSGKKGNYPLRNLATKYYNVNTNIIKGCKLIKCSFVKGFFERLKINCLEFQNVGNSLIE